MKHAYPKAKLRGIFSACLMMLFAVVNSSLFAIDTPWLRVEGKWIRDPNGNNVVLRGVSLAGLAQSRTRTVNQRIDMATNTANGWYSRVVRLPVEPGEWNAGPDNYFNNILNPAVQYCISKGVYVIIDWHHVADYQQHTTATNNFWNYVAPRYKNNPQVLYEVFNEPINPNDWTTFKNWVQPIVNNIRSKAPNNLVLVASPRWATQLSGAINNPVTGGNIVYVSHNYPSNPATGTASWDAAFGNAANKYPVLVTEWGYEYPGYGNAPSEGTTSGFGVPFKNYIESKPNVGWTAWAFDNAWGPEMFDSSWNLLGGENHMGQFAKDWLYEKRNSDLPGSSASPYLEAEHAVLSGAVVGNGYSGYSGSGYVDFINASNDYIEWTANAAAAGTYELEFRYSNGSTNRPLRLSINGTVVQSSVSFPNTGGWGTWSTVKVQASLSSGSNKVRLTAIGSSGPDIDYLNLTTATSSDTQAPSAPTSLSASNITASAVTLTWTASTDNIGVAGYDVFNGTTKVNSANVTSTTYQVTGLSGGTSYTFTIRARDAAGNVSAGSNAVTVTTSSSTKHEAEDASLSGCVVRSVYGGYSGSGYVDFINASNDYIQWTVSASTAGTKLLQFRYCNGSTTSRPLRVTVNGTVVQSSQAFSPTGGWGTWNTVTVSASLVAGSNTIRLTAIGSSGPDIDFLTVVTSATSSGRIATGDEKMVVSEEEPTGGVELYPNPTSDELHIETKDDLTGATISVFDMKGTDRGCPYKTSGNKAVVQTAKLERGAYVVTIKNAAKLLRKKVLIK